MQKKIAGLKGLKIKIIKKRKEKNGRRKKNGEKGKPHSTVKAQCRGRSLQKQKI